MTTPIKNSIYVLHTEDKMIYKIASINEFGSDSLGFLYSLELVAGYDYINPDENNIQGYVIAENFVEEVQEVEFSVYPLIESLGERLKEEGFEVIDINKFKVHY